MRKTGIRMLAVFLSLVMLILPNISLAAEITDSNNGKTFISLEGQTVKQINSRMLEIDGEIHLLNKDPIRGFVEGEIVALIYDLGHSFLTVIVDKAYESYRNSIMYEWDKLSLQDKYRVVKFFIKFVSKLPGARIDRLEYHDPAGCVMHRSGSSWICPYSI